MEVEYQTDTIGKFSLDFDGDHFKLVAIKTDCLATELCGIDTIKTKANKSLAELGTTMGNTCTPGGGCC